MNIIIPLCGKGKRFGGEGKKPFVKVFEKEIICYVLDCLKLCPEDEIFIFYSNKLKGFKDFIMQKYSALALTMIELYETSGAAETIYEGIKKSEMKDKKTLVIDGDTFYGEDIVGKYRGYENAIFYMESTEEEAIYSYIKLNVNEKVLEIKEKEKISNNANTGAYGFKSVKQLKENCEHVLQNGIKMKNEPYTSCVIDYMISKGEEFKGIKVNSVYSLGTPEAVDKYVYNIMKKNEIKI